MNNDNFLIESSDIEAIQELCGCIKDSKKRSLAVANALAAELAKKYFTEISLDSVTTLHETPQVLEKIDVADIYIKNNYIDVRLYFENDAPRIPQNHFANGLKPLAYMFIKVDRDLSTGTVTGFYITPETNDNEQAGEYITLSENDLVSYYDLENNLTYNNEADFDENFEIDIFNYLDDKLDNCEEFYELLTKSPEGRYKLKNAAKTKQILECINLETNSDTLNLAFEEEATLMEESNDDGFEVNIEEDLEENILSDAPIDDKDFLLDLEETTDSLPEFDTDNTENIVIAQEIDESDDLEFFENSEPTEEELLATDEAFEPISELEVEENNENSNLDLVEDDLEQATDNIEEVVVENNDEEYNVIETDDQLEDNSEEILVEFDDSVQEENDTELDEVVELQENNFEEVTKDDNVQEVLEYSTNTTPSLSTIEADDEISELDEESLINELDKQDSEFLKEEEEGEADDDEFKENSADIDTLFNENNIDNTDDNIEENTNVVENKKTNSSPLKLIGILAVLIALGYFGYTKFYNFEQPQNTYNDTKVVTPPNNTSTKPIAKPVPMPNETVENIKNVQQSNEAVNETIPAIENNLDTPIVLTNLSVRWEVPSSYISSNTAKRYFTKLGKILQLNLKTELLLLNKQPLSNKISVELTFNKSTKRFETKNIIVSSGEKFIDEVIINTVNNALNINISSNMSVFENIVGNPVLVIHL